MSLLLLQYMNSKSNLYCYHTASEQPNGNILGVLLLIREWIWRFFRNGTKLKEIVLAMAQHYTLAPLSTFNPCISCIGLPLHKTAFPSNLAIKALLLQESMLPNKIVDIKQTLILRFYIRFRGY